MPKVTEKIPEPVLSVKAALTALGVADTVRIFDEEVPTAAAAASVLGCEVAAITNSLIFEVDGEPLLILASGAAKVDTAYVARRLETGQIRRAKPEFVLAHTGQEVGGVAPVGHPAKIRTILDNSLRVHYELWAGAGDHHSMFSITYEDLRRITDAEELDVR